MNSYNRQLSVDSVLHSTGSGVCGGGGGGGGGRMTVSNTVGVRRLSLFYLIHIQAMDTMIESPYRATAWLCQVLKEYDSITTFT